MNLLFLWLVAFFVLLYLSFEFAIDVWLGWLARYFRWVRRWSVERSGRRVANEKLEEDKQELYNMGMNLDELEGFDLTADHAFDELSREYGEAIADERLDEVKWVEEMF